MIDFFFNITFFSSISIKTNLESFNLENKTNPFCKSLSQYLANSSGDFADFLASFLASRVTALSLINLLKA